MDEMKSVMGNVGSSPNRGNSKYERGQLGFNGDTHAGQGGRCCDGMPGGFSKLYYNAGFQNANSFQQDG